MSLNFFEFWNFDKVNCRVFGLVNTCWHVRKQWKTLGLIPLKQLFAFDLTVSRLRFSQFFHCIKSVQQDILWSTKSYKTWPTYLIKLDHQRNSKFFEKVDFRCKRLCHFFGDSYGHSFNVEYKIRPVLIAAGD